MQDELFQNNLALSLWMNSIYDGFVNPILYHRSREISWITKMNFARLVPSIRQRYFETKRKYKWEKYCFYGITIFYAMFLDKNGRLYFCLVSKLLGLRKCDSILKLRKRHLFKSRWSAFLAILAKSPMSQLKHQKARKLEVRAKSLKTSCKFNGMMLQKNGVCPPRYRTILIFQNMKNKLANRSSKLLFTISVIEYERITYYDLLS